MLSISLLILSLLLLTWTAAAFNKIPPPFRRSNQTVRTMTKALTQSDYLAKLQANTKLTSSDVATLPKPGTTAPSSIKFVSPTKIAYLLAPDATSLTRQLFVMDTTTGISTPILVGGDALEEGSFSHEEQMRRERARLMATGVTSYQLSSSEDAPRKILVPHGGGLWLLDADETTPRLLIDKVPSGAPLLDAKLSADGSTVAFVADKEVHVMTTDDKTPKQVTFGAGDGITNGVADYLAQEELERPEGFWLSPNGQNVAFEQVDETHIPAYRIVHQAEPKGLATSLLPETSPEDMVKATTVTYEEHRFCFAGTVNPKVKLGIQKVADSQDVLWLDLESLFGPDFYLAKVEWLKDNTGIIVQVLDRRQQKLAVVHFDAATGTRTKLHLEQAADKAWINLNGAFRVLEHTNDKLQFLWASEKDGYRHLYVMETSMKDDAFDSKQVHRLTGPGEYIVDSVVDVDQDNKLVYFMGTSPGKWLGKHLFRVPLQGGEAEPHKLTPEKGMHSCVVNSKAGIFVDAVSSVDYPTKVTLRQLDSNEILQEIYNASDTDPRLEALDLKAPTFHTFTSTDNKVTLQAAVYLPDPAIHGPGPYPLLVATYGGPHVQYVQNSWGMTCDLRSQFLRDHGLAVLKVDNRGSNRRGLVFETPLWGNMGDLEVADQVAGVQFAIQQGWAMANKVAISGWSYGGYMSIKAISERPDIFHAAVVGAPVTDWTLYDTAYTERYMGLPQENVEGYQKSSALFKIADIQGSLMVCHGLMDENVLFRQTAVLINQLIEHQKAYDLAMFPSERHGPRRPQDRAFLEERILSFLQRSLCL